MAYVIVFLAFSDFSSSHHPVNTRKPAYIIIMTVTRAINPFKNIIILTTVDRNILVSNVRFVHSVGIPKRVSPPQSPHP